jgi:hypothetical protein
MTPAIRNGEVGVDVHCWPTARLIHGSLGKGLVSKELTHVSAETDKHGIT